MRFADYTVLASEHIVMYFSKRQFKMVFIKIIITYWTKKHQAALTHKMSQVINSLYVYGNIYYHVQGAATVLKHSLQKELASKMLQIMGNWEDTSTDY